MCSGGQKEEIVGVVRRKLRPTICCYYNKATNIEGTKSNQFKDLKIRVLQEERKRREHFGKEAFLEVYFYYYGRTKQRVLTILNLVCSVLWEGGGEREGCFIRKGRDSDDYLLLQ